ncbi:MAG: hypothetical protein IS632_02855 [Thaumarchaeota archaeon]|nr:hypothetical protein [Nitrososphaerota archaeon]
MASSKRGKVLTIAILAAITVASFVVWLVPQDLGMTIITDDYGGLLDSAISIHGTLQDSLTAQYQNMLAGSVMPAEYAEVAQITSAQVTEQIRILVTASPPQEWAASYEQYIESLRAFNSMIRETAVVAEAISSGGDVSHMEPRIAELRGLSAEHAELSDAARP